MSFLLFLELLFSSWCAQPALCLIISRALVLDALNRCLLRVAVSVCMAHTCPWTCPPVLLFAPHPGFTWYIPGSIFTACSCLSWCLLLAHTCTLGRHTTRTSLKLLQLSQCLTTWIGQLSHSYIDHAVSIALLHHYYIVIEILPTLWPGNPCCTLSGTCYPVDCLQNNSQASQWDVLANTHRSAGRYSDNNSNLLLYSIRVAAVLNDSINELAESIRDRYAIADLGDPSASTDVGVLLIVVHVSI